ncbi:MAG: hypothetical protein AB7F79_00770 [Steroidobacteraceae bacterium]
MRDSASQCITRIVDGTRHELHLAQLQAVMQRIQTSLRDIPEAERTHVGNALLNRGESPSLHGGLAAHRHS